MNFMFLILFLLTNSNCILAKLFYSSQDVTILVGEEITLQLISSEKVSDINATFIIEDTHSDLIRSEPKSIILNSPPNEWKFTLFGLKPGHSDIYTQIDPKDATNADEAYARITIQHSYEIYYTSLVIGWIYFAAWSISFYPQIYTNFKRKSVVGLNFDFIALNLVGFLLYSLFNCGLYWIPVIEEEYLEKYPRGLNPVQPNDIGFSLHALFATIITLCQCFIFERQNQTISITARVILGIFTLFIVISIILAGTAVITWLDFLYYCSYVKLAITLIKYVPQAYMNYKRKSTEGWSIGNIFLDFTGGMLSMLQMILNGYNYNDWESIFGDPTKFGLGLFSVIFDIFFIMQHYWFYRRSREYTPIEGNNIESQE